MKRVILSTLLLLTMLSGFSARRVLYIGDSITDGGWGRSGGSAKASKDRNHTDLNHVYGHSYMMLCAAYYQSQWPDGDWQFWNRGISGNTLYEMADRWQDDALNLQPDVISILIGTNDVAAYEQECKQEGKAFTVEGFDYSRWEQQYRHLLDTTRQVLPHVDLVLCTPFVGKSRGQERMAITDSLAQIVRQIARDYRAVLVPFDSMFKAEHFDAQQWAALFRESGARYVIPTAEHHDGFAMYESNLTRWNAKQMGPQRDIIGELAEAVRHEGLKFGVSNHRIENWDFMYPLNMPKDSTDLFLPEYADLYGPPQKPTEQSGMGPKAMAAAANGDATEAVINESAEEGRHPQSDAFLNEWELRVYEIIDRYQPDLLYFDNGINYRSLDPWKLRIARYYYNSAHQWQREVSIQSKAQAYLAGSIQDFERESRAPKQPYDCYWQVDDPIGNKFGYIEGLKLQSADGIIRNLVSNVACGGNLCLNISPKADGTIPDDQQQVLRHIGQWLRENGEGIYGTRPYQTAIEKNIRFTQKDGAVYAFVLKWDGKPFTIQSIDGSKVKNITRLADGKKMKFQRLAGGGISIDAHGEATNAATGFNITI